MLFGALTIGIHGFSMGLGRATIVLKGFQWSLTIGQGPLVKQ